MHDDRSSPESVEAWIEKNFSGHGRAIRRLSDDPIQGEPYMSMADAKELTREAIATFSRHAQCAPGVKMSEVELARHFLRIVVSDRNDQADVFDSARDFLTNFDVTSKASTVTSTERAAFCSQCMGKGYVVSDHPNGGTYTVDCPTCTLTRPDGGEVLK